MFLLVLFFVDQYEKVPTAFLFQGFNNENNGIKNHPFLFICMCVSYIKILCVLN